MAQYYDRISPYRIRRNTIIYEEKGASTVRRKTIRRDQFVARQFVARQFVADQFVAEIFFCVLSIAPFFSILLISQITLRKIFLNFLN